MHHCYIFISAVNILPGKVIVGHLSFWPTVLSVVPLARCVVCLSVCRGRLSVTFCIVAKRYVLVKNCLKKWIGSQGQKVHFFGSPPYFYFRFRRYGPTDGGFCLMYCGEMVRPSKKVSEGVNRKPGSKSWFLGSPPYFYFRFRRYGHWDIT